MKKKNGVIHGWGINDADYKTSLMYPTPWECPIYARWRSMFNRCKGKPRPTRAYDNCEIDEKFKYLSDFIAWSKTEGFSPENSKLAHLDKDIKIRGNKLYSPDTCVFVPRTINSIIVDLGKQNEDYPAGVIKRKSNWTGKPFLTGCLMNKGKMQYLGVRETPEECHALWQSAKAEIILDLLPEYKQFCIDTGIKHHKSVELGLEERAKILKDDLNNNRITVSYN